MATSTSTPSSSVALAIIFATTFALLGGASAKGALNLTEILERGQQYGRFIRLLEVTQAGHQIENQLNNSHDGVTVFAPTDNAFNNLKAGLLNSLSQQEQVAFVLSHVLPKFYTLDSFQTASNPLRTQASGNGGDFYLNVTSSVRQVNVSTGIVTAPLRPMNVTEPLAVYSIDKVLKPDDLFGVKPKKKKVTTPPPTSETDDGKKDNSDSKSETAAPKAEPSGAVGFMVGGWRSLAAFALLAALIVT